MKRKKIKRLTTIIVSIFLVCSCLVSVFAVKVTASAESYSNSVNINNSTTIKTKIKTKTTIQIINANNYLLKEAKKENKVLKKVKSDGKDWVTDTFALVNAIKNSSDDTDWEKIGVETVKNILTSIAGIWGFDGIASALLEGIESLTSSGQAPLSEVQVLSDDINKRFNEMSDQLYDIEEELGALSNQVTSSVNDILSGSQTQINNLDAKQILRSFMSSGEGNFSYLEYSNYLYGNKSNSVNASEAYYFLLLEAIQSDASDEVIEYYYNKLFESIYTNIAIYNQYYYGEVAGLDKSIVAYYYDYLYYNPDLVDDGTSAEYQALLFALDLYTTYVYSYEILEMCLAHQVTNMYLDATLENRDISNVDTYEYANGKRISYSTIKAELADMHSNLVLAEEQVAADIAYILSMNNSYIVVDRNGEIHSIGNYGDSFGNIADGQTVYLNVIPDEICDLFELNSDKFSFYIDEDKYENKGFFNIDDSNKDTFVAALKYGDTELYSITFTKIDSINNNSQSVSIREFSGGSGTPDDPYLISNNVQLDMINDNLDASYKLISNIDLKGTAYYPIGTIENPFTGIFDGNGYSIDNLNFNSLKYDETQKTMTPTTGVFGTIGNNGVVKNLTLKNLKVDSDYKKDQIYPENEISYFYIGGIAGVNNGTISNCTITNNSSINVNRLKNTKNSRTVKIYIGGIAGDNRGTIEYCSTGELSITAESYLYYYNESTKTNEHLLYVGGIAGTTSNNIKNCRVSEKTSISAYAKSIANSEDNEKPILKVYAGGIIADDSAIQYISNVYSACNFTKCKGEIYNEGTYWGKHRYSWDKVSVKKGQYYPTYLPLSSQETIDEYENNFISYKKYPDYYIYVSTYGYVLVRPAGLKSKLVSEEKKANSEAIKKLGEKIIADYDNSIFVPNNEKTKVTIELTDNLCDINTSYLTEYFDKLVGEENQDKNIKFVDASGNTVDATVVSYYGFNTYHEFESVQELKVKVFFYVDDILMSDDVVLSVKGKELVKWEIKDFYKETFDTATSVDDCKEIIFNHGFKVVYTYSNGQVIQYFVNDASGATIVDFITSEPGSKTIIIYHNDQPAGKLLKFEQTIEFACHHTNDDFEKIETIEANCKFSGYEIWKCKKCGEKIEKNYVSGGEHKYVVESGKEVTCREAGYTEKAYCSVCGEVFQEKEFIQVLPHKYVSDSDDDYRLSDLYPSTEYHYCTNGNHYEVHQYTVKEYVDEEGKLVYLYSCSSCGYENPVPDYNIKTKENGEKPVVIITDGYVLNVGDQVTVYVQIKNNPGFIGAAFGIRYDDGLELISYSESTLVPKLLKASNEVYNGYNFLWGDIDETTEDDYLLELIFKYTDELCRDQNISLVYGMNNGTDGGFCTSNNEYHKFMTQSGTIFVVDHLPGDVDGDGIVDIMDATYIAWNTVGKKDIKDANGNEIQINLKYADVDLDGKSGLSDVLAILQSISGRYGTSLLSSKYKLFLELNGFITDEVDESVMVEFYDENGNRTKWSENIDFDKYETSMAQKGYTFVGWYTRKACTCNENCKHFLKTSDFITYDKEQWNQTLYARWEKNKITFDMNGATSEQLEDIVYDSNKSIVTLTKPVLSYEVSYYVSEEESTTLPIYKTFEGWYIKGTNTKVTEIDLSEPNIGTINLVAKWSEYKWEKPTEDRYGYKPVTDWYYNKYYDEKYLISEINDTTMGYIIDNGYILYGQENLIEYRIKYEGIDDVIDFVPQNDYYNIKDTFSFEQQIKRKGYEFEGWYVDGYNDSITSVSTLILLKKGDVTLKAKWKYKTYVIEVKIIDTNKHTKTDNKGNPKYGTGSSNGLIEYTTMKLYYTYGDSEKEQGYYTDSNFNKKVSITTFGEYDNFVFGGLFGLDITDNGHSYASYDKETCVLSETCEFISEPTSLNEEPIDGKNATLYVLLKPNLYTVKLDVNSEGLLDNVYTSGTYSGNNLNVEYDVSKRIYTLTNSGTNDPYCTIGQYVYLEAGQLYDIHMKILGSDKTNAVQMFYGINGAFTEEKSVRFGGDKTNNTIFITESGKYLIRFDNDSEAKLSISDFWIVPSSVTKTTTVYYNEKLKDISMPQSLYYEPTGYTNGKAKYYYDVSGKGGTIYDITGDTTLYCQWEQKYDGTYIKDETDLKNISLAPAGTYHIITDIVISEVIDSLGSTWEPIAEFSGTIDGHNHIIRGIKYWYESNEDNYGEAEKRYGFIRALNNNGTIKNITFDNLTMYIKKWRDGVEENMTGGVVGYLNDGTLDNVQVINSDIWNQHYRKFEKGTEDVNTFVGGIVGKMESGTVSNCAISGTTTIGGRAGTAQGNADAHCFVGGIVGYQVGGEVKNCSRSDSVTVTSCTRVYDSSTSASRSLAGGIVGRYDGGTISLCTSTETNVSGKWDNEGTIAKKDSYCYDEAIYGNACLVN